MNKQRRKAIDALINRLDEMRSDITEIMGEEDEYRDNMPESIRGGERGQKADAAIDALDNAEQYISDLIESLQEAREQ